MSLLNRNGSSNGLNKMQALSMDIKKISAPVDCILCWYRRPLGTASVNVSAELMQFTTANVIVSSRHLSLVLCT